MASKRRACDRLVRMAELLPAYLIVGEDELKRERVLERLQANVAARGDIDFNLDVFESTAEGADVIAACNTLPFASSVRLVLVHGVDAMKKQSVSALVDYLGNPSPSTVLALVGAKVPKSAALYKAASKLGKSAVIDCAPLKRRELPSRVRDMAATHGIAISLAAATRLVELVGENTVALDAELHKIALAHPSKAPIGASAIEALVAHTSKTKYWDFVDAFASRDLPRCLALYAHLDDSPVIMLARCVARLRELISAPLPAQKPDRAARTAWPRRRDVSLFGVPAWKLKNHASWARLWAAEELKEALIAARDADRAMKSGADQDDAFLNWVESSIVGS